MNSAPSYKSFKLTAAPFLTKEHVRKKNRGEHNKTEIF